MGPGISYLLPAAIFMRRAKGFTNRIKRNMTLAEKVAGVLLLRVGVAMLLGLFTRLSFWYLAQFPALAELG